MRGCQIIVLAGAIGVPGSIGTLSCLRSFLPQKSMWYTEVEVKISLKQVFGELLSAQHKKQEVTDLGQRSFCWIDFRPSLSYTAEQLQAK